MNPGTLLTGVGIERQPLQRILGRERRRHLVPRGRGPQQKIGIEIPAYLDARLD